MARLRVALRRQSMEPDQPILELRGLKMDVARRLVTVDDAKVQLTPTEYDLLRVLMLNAGKVLTHNQLLKQVWGSAYAGEIHTLRVNISNIRHKIETDPARPQYLVTESGVGYRLRAE